MAVDTPSITRPLAPAPSLNYEQLFLEGIQHIEQLSGKIWTDYNAHDPGITILEVLSYAITELGYRCDFAMGDIIEPSPESAILNDFFSLANVGTNAPLTIDDFRKLLIDIDGNRNAWLEKVIYKETTDVPNNDPDPNAHLYFHESVTGFPGPLLNNNPSNGTKISIKGLYDVFLQFEEHPEFGDLNDNSLKATILIQPIGHDNPLPFEFEFEFPVWGDIDADLADDLHAYLETSTPPVTFELKVNPSFTEITGEDFVYDFGLKVKFDDGVQKTLSLKLSARLLTNQDEILNRADFRFQLEDEIDGVLFDKSDAVHHSVAQLVVDFIYRREVIKGLLETSRRSLASHRNLCEDFRAVHPMSLQEIGLDLDLDILPGTDCEGVMAQVYYLTQHYLSPAIRFYSLREMLEKGYTPEQIFRGPWLQHGFIDENDLSFYLRREVLYTSDLVQEFMKIPGVRAVNFIAFSRYELGKLAYKENIQQANLTECLCLINPARYLPRLNYDRSSIRMNCGPGKPKQPNKENALKRLSELKAVDNLKGRAEQGDFEIPHGIYSHLADYHSIQHEFPLNYAIGAEGLAPSETTLRKAQAQQLKGYLLFFEQLLGNFLSQLENLRKLFSYSADIDRTYFTQALYNVPRVAMLVRDYTENYYPLPLDNTFEDYIALQNPNSAYYALKLDALAESNPVFQDRRKRFLDHLLGRFNETFSEYAAYTFGRALSTSEKYGILIQDQARFLRNYVMHSHDRGTGFNYQRSLEVSSTLIKNWYWRAGLDVESLNEESGGSEPLPVENPDFVDAFEEFDIYQDASGNYRFRLFNANGLNMLYSTSSYATEDLLKTDLRLVIDAGKVYGNYLPLTSPVSLTVPMYGVLAKVGTAYFNSYDNAVTGPGGPYIALLELAAYLDQLDVVDTLPVENEQGHALWQGVNDVTGIKKRMTFLTGLPNVNRQYIHPFLRFNLVGSVPNLNFELVDDEGTVILTSVPLSSFATVDAVWNHVLMLYTQMDTLSLVADTLGEEVRIDPLDGDTTIAIVTPAFEPSISVLTERWAAMVAYLRRLYHIENLHVVEHILLRQRKLNTPTLEARLDESCPALDILDPYSFRISVILPKWAGRFTEQSFRTLFKRLMRAEVPAHVYINFFWIDPLQMYHFEKHWATWLEGDWDGPAGVPDGNGGTDYSDTMVPCLNDLKNLLDAQYVLEPPKIKDEYEPCEIIAAPYDPDGDIVKAFLAPGYTLPAGLCMDSCSGAIRVTDPSQLDDDIDAYDFEIITINAGGEEVWHDITITFIPNGEAVVDEIIDTHYICWYKTAPGTEGLSLITFKDSDIGGIIVEATMLQWQRSEPVGTVLETGSVGTMPDGMDFNTTDGEITVLGYTALKSGYYEFEVKLKDDSGGYTILYPTLTILADQEAVASTTAAKNEDAYANGDVLATISDPDGNLQLTSITAAIPGIGLESVTYPVASVDVVVTDAANFHAWLLSSPLVTISGGHYHFTLHTATLDHCAGSTNLDILIKVKVDHEAVFIPVPIINVSLHNVGSLLGRIQDLQEDGLVSYKLLENNALLNPIGLSMTLAGFDPDEALIKVSNKPAFTAAINAAPADANRVATIIVPLETKDVEGGLSIVNAIIKAKQDIPPVVTVYTPHNVDTYLQGDVLATITDVDGTGIASASHVYGGFTLGSIGMQLRLQGGYPGYSNPYPYGSGGSGSSQGSGGMYQTIPAPLFYQPPTQRYAEIIVQNVGLFRQAVAQGQVYTEVNSVTHEMEVILTINTTDSAGGFASNVVAIRVLDDVESEVIEFMNGHRIDAMSDGSILLRFQNTDENSSFQFANVSPQLSKAKFGTSMTTDTFDIMVSNKANLVPEQIPITVTITDSLGGETVHNVTLRILPRLLIVNYTMGATQQGHILNIGAKVADLKVLGFTLPYLPVAFGAVSLNNGTQLGFTEGSTYSTSNYRLGVGFQGVITSTSEPVEGVLTIERQAGNPSSAAKGMDTLGGNPIINSKTTQDNAQLRTLVDETGNTIALLNKVTYFPDNPVLHSSPELLADYAWGTKDAEVAATLKALTTSTVAEILKWQATLRGAQGATKVAAGQNLEVFTELLQLQVMAAIHFAGDVREEDITTTLEVQSLFEFYRQELSKVFDGTPDVTVFTELSKLRRTLRGAQDVYADTKPNLSFAIASLLPLLPLTALSGLEEKLPSPHTGEINAEVLTLIGQFRDEFDNLNSQFADSEFRIGWAEGQNVLSILPFLDLFPQLISYLKRTDALLRELPYGVQQLDLQHAYTCAKDLLVISVNALFELLDQLPPELDGNFSLIKLMQDLSNHFKTISAQAGLADFRNLIASWTSKWPLKPMLGEPMEASFEVATLEMEPPQVIERYAAGDTIAFVRMVAGTLASIRVSQGILPRGLVLTSGGRIIVEDPTLLLEGIYGDIELSGSNDRGFGFTLKVLDIEFYYDIEATYTVLDPVPIDQYYTGMILAYPTDQDGNLATAQVQLGKFPRGVRLNTETGEFSVARVDKLVAGIYPLTVVTVDEKGGETLHEIEIQIGDGSAVIEQRSFEATLPLRWGHTIGSLGSATAPVTDAHVVSGSLPDGLSLSADGNIFVANPSALYPITMNCEIEGMQSGILHLYQVTITLHGGTVELPPQYSAIYVVFSEVLPLTNGAALGDLNPGQATLVSVSPVHFPLPAGVDVDDNGMIYVSGGTLLVAGQHQFLVRTEDDLGNINVYYVYLKLMDLSPLGPEPDRIILNFEHTLPLTEGFAIGEIEVNGFPLQSLTVLGGELPDGVGQTAVYGLVVSDASMLHLGRFSWLLDVQTTEAGQNNYQVEVRIRFTGTGPYPGRYIALYKEFLGIQLPLSVAGPLVQIEFPSFPLGPMAFEEGDLPNGMSLHADGWIMVDSPGIQVAGIYDFIAMSALPNFVDVGIIVRIELVEQTIELSQELSDVELPIFNPQTIGTISVPGVTLTNFQLVSGILPTGTSLLLNGNIDVNPGQGRAPGSFVFTVSADGSNGANYLIEVTLEYVDAVASQPLALDFMGIRLPLAQSYLIGTIVDGTIDMTQAEFESGSFPAGVILRADGDLIVTNPQALQAGTYQFTAATLGVNSVTYLVTVTIEFLPVIVELPLTLPDVELPVFEDDVLGTITVQGVTLSNVQLNSGSLPTESALSSDGVIMALSGQGRLEDDFNFVVWADGSDGKEYHITVTVAYVDEDESQAFAIGFEKRLPVSQGQVIGTIVYGTTPMEKAEFESGNLPPGIVIQQDGAIVVSNPASVTIGEYDFFVVTRDQSGLTYLADVTVEILTELVETSVGLQDVELPVFTDDELGTITLTGVVLTNFQLASGSLPPGTELSSSGVLTASAGQGRVDDEYDFYVSADGSDGKDYLIHVTVTFVDYVLPTEISKEFRNLPRPLLPDYVIGQLAPVGVTFVKAEVSGPNFPAGVKLDSDGRLWVDNLGAVVEGTYVFDVVALTSTDGDYLIEVTVELPEPPIETELVFEDVELPVFQGDLIGLIEVGGVTLTNFRFDNGDPPFGLTLDSDGSLLAVYEGPGREVGTVEFYVAADGSNGRDYLIAVDVIYIDEVSPFEEFEQEFRGHRLPLQSGYLIGTIAFEGISMVKAEVRSGIFPPGCILEGDGQIRVFLPAMLQPGLYVFFVDTQDASGNNYLADITVEILPA